MMDAVRPFTYLLGEPPLHPNSGFRKPDGIYGPTGARPTGSPSIPGGQEGILIERSNAEQQNNELSRPDIPSAYRSFEANLHLPSDSEYKGNNQQTAANRSNSQLKSVKAAHEMNVPVVPPKPTNDVQADQPPASKSSTDCKVGVAKERLSGDQSKEGSNPDDSDNNDEYLYGQVKRRNDSKTERWEDMTPKRIPYEIPAPFSYTEPIRAAAAAPTWGRGEKQPTSVDENRQLELEDVVIDDFSDLCSSLSSVADSSSREDHHPFARSAPVAPSKTESREEEFTESDDPTKRPKLPEIFLDASSMNNSRNSPMQNSTFAAKPFTYLTGECPPSKSAFLRSGEISGTSLSPEANASPRPVRNPSTLEKDTDLGQRMVPKVQYNDESSHQDGINTYQPVDPAVVLHPRTYSVEQKAASDYTIKQQKPTDLQDQSKVTAAQVKKVPVVPPKRANDQTEERSTEEGDSSGFLRFTSRESLFGDRVNNGQVVDRLKKDGRRSDHSEDDSELLYGQVKQRHLRDVKTDKDSTSSSSAAHEIPPPFSYTEPIRPAAPAPFHAEKQSPSNDKGKRSDFEGGGGAVVDLDDLCPSSSPSTDVQTLFDNFILVKATNPGKLTRQKEFAPKEPPTKQPKFLEIFDPPPPSLIGSRKVSILGVTSTESSDFHVDYKPKIANGNSYYDKTKGPVSTFDNPDYNISSNYTEPRSNLHTVVDFRSDSSKSLVASNSMDRTGDAPVQVASTRQRRCDRRLCIAILVTALVTSVICLGAGFVAGWFGRGKSIGN